MPLARAATVIPGQPGMFHCYTRCVRRSFLCGIDEKTGQCFEHRRQWIVDRFIEVTRIFAVDIYSYAVMQNHYHVVLYIDPTRVDSWSDKEVIRRWGLVYSWRNPRKKLVKLPATPPPEVISEWRERLGSLSWVMRSINEPIARWSNAEDQVTGHFWEGRFNSLPLLDEVGLLACMSYADLNPIRAGMVIDPADSEFTSIQRRIKALMADPSQSKKLMKMPLGPIFTSAKKNLTLNLSNKQYIALIYATAESAIQERRGTRRVLTRLNISTKYWSQVVNNMMTLFHTAVGSEQSFEAFMSATNRIRQRDLNGRAQLYS